MISLANGVAVTPVRHCARVLRANGSVRLGSLVRRADNSLQRILACILHERGAPLGGRRTKAPMF
jgi:hypothetical protein